MPCDPVPNLFCLIEAPFPVVQQIVVLPNPEFGDLQGPTGTVLHKRAMDGTNITHVKAIGRRLYNFTFSLTRAKSIELLAFYEVHAGSPWRFTTYDGTKIVGNCKANPLILQMDKRAVYDTDEDGVQVSFEFEGTIQ